MHKPEIFVQLQALLVVGDRRLEVAVVLIGLRHPGVQAGHRGPVGESLREYERALVDRQRLARVAGIRYGERQVNESAEVKRRVLNDAVVAGEDALLEQPDLLVISMCPTVCGREDRLDANLLLRTI